VGKKKKVLVLTDNAESSVFLAKMIARTVKGKDFPGFSATVTLADDFSGTDILPVHAFFLGCGEPEPPSFYYIEELMYHINLAGRFCGVFSGNAKAVKYLSALVRPCEAAAGKPLYAKNGLITSDEMLKWIQSILKLGEKDERF